MKSDEHTQHRASTRIDEMNFAPTLSTEEFERCGRHLEEIAKSAVGVVPTRLFAEGLPPAVEICIIERKSFGATSAWNDDHLKISLSTGTFDYLLNRVRPWIFSFDVPKVLVADFSTRTTDQSEGANKLRNSFSWAVAALAVTALVAHEIAHALNGHIKLLNPATDGSLTEAELIEQQNVRSSNGVRHALEFNADFAAVDWTLGSFLRQADLIDSSLPVFPEFRTQKDRAATWAIVVAILGATYSQFYSPKVSLTEGSHPVAPVRFEALIRASRVKINGNAELLSAFDTIVSKMAEAVRVEIAEDAPAFSVESWRADMRKEHPQSYLTSIGTTWASITPWLERYKMGPEVAFSVEMSTWRETLLWNSNSIL